MNVLFYLDEAVPSRFGGIENATGRLATFLSKKGDACYYIHRMNTSNYRDPESESYFVSSLYIPNISEQKSTVLQKLINWHIDVIIIQSVFDETIIVWRELVNKLDYPCKLIFAYHYNPGSEYDYLQGLAISVKSLITRIRWKRYVKRIYNTIWRTADKIVVLSNNHVSTWMNLSSANSSDKFIVIPNMNSFDHALEIEDLNKKEKIVLIVSRLSEHEKKISKLLKVWKHIKNDSNFNDWELVIVGDGPDKPAYVRYAKENLSSYVFTGKQPSHEYFKIASLFVMSSVQEGWGLVITEAQQLGCVPIVMNTFSSAKDIINDGENGFLVNYEWQFLRKLKQLMSDSEIRERMAKNAIESSHRFEKEKVGKMWLDLLQQ